MPIIQLDEDGDDCNRDRVTVSQIIFKKDVDVDGHDDDRVMMMMMRVRQPHTSPPGPHLR